MRFESRRFGSTKECQKFKRSVRSRKEWAELKKIVWKRQNGLDPFTKKKLSPHAHLHHLNCNNDFYDDLNPDNFMLLNPKTHEAWHFMFDNFEMYCLNKEELLKSLVKARELTSMRWGEDVRD